MIVHVHGDPAPQGSVRAINVRGVCRVVAGGDNASKKKLAAWRKAVAKAAKETMGGADPWDCPVWLAVRFHLPAPGSPRWPQAATGFDLDKLTRALLDGLTGVVFVNDARVCKLTAEKVWSDVGGAVVDVRPM